MRMAEEREGHRYRAVELKINLNVEFVIPCANEGGNESESERKRLLPSQLFVLKFNFQFDKIFKGNFINRV